MSFNPAFAEAQNLSISGGSFHQNNIQLSSHWAEPGEMSYLDSQWSTIKFIGFEILRRKASPSATHDASARYPPPRCDPGTREKIVADIMQWIKDPSPNRSILWLNGPFGNGKSAIMQTISDKLSRDSQSSHLFAASFFFGRGMGGRDKAEYLIPTIAYQIAVSDPRIRKLINEALIQDPLILDKSSFDISSPTHFTKSLVIHLRLAVSIRPLSLSMGWTKCDGRDFQRHILNAISTAVFTDHIQLRFLIASRPEPQISETFRIQPLDQHHYHMCKRRVDIMSVEHPWPSAADLSTIVRRASGHFLYGGEPGPSMPPPPMPQLSMPTQHLAPPSGFDVRHLTGSWAMWQRKSFFLLLWNQNARQMILIL